MISIDIASTILQNYGVNNNVKSIDIIQNNESAYRERKVYSICTSNGNRYICKMSRGEYTKDIIEMQCKFAMLLFNEKISTARKYDRDGEYVTEFIQNGKSYYLTLEQYIGEDIKQITIDVFAFLGNILGKMHMISENNNQFSEFTIIKKAILQGNAKFENILKNANMGLPYTSSISECIRRHNRLVDKLKNNWDRLPHGIVHGDLGAFNNLINMGDNIGIIDFNLAADETFLGDVIATFYASLHKYSWREQLSAISEAEAKKVYFKEYTKVRPFTEEEKQIFMETSALFDGLFYSKAIIEEWNLKKDLTVLDKFDEAVLRFDIERHRIK